MSSAVKEVGLVTRPEMAGTDAPRLFLEWTLKRYGVRLVDPSDADVVLVSLIDLRDLALVRAVRRKNKRAKIIVGGMGTSSPASVGKVADAVVLGEGSSFLDVLFTRGYEAALAEPNVWIDGDSRRPAPSYDFDWRLPPMFTVTGIMVVISRGCRRRCNFCQVGWTTRYNEHPDPYRLCNRLKAIQLRRKKSDFRYLTNDFSALSFSGRLPKNNFISTSIAYLKKGHTPPQNFVRLGVEGVSERLRKMVAKPISRDDLLEQTLKLSALGKSVKWFFIAGLPGETADDWTEIKDVIQTWKRHAIKGPLEVSFCSFIPMGATPLSVAALSDDYWANWLDFKEWFFKGHGYSNRILIKKPAMPKNRNKLAELETALTIDELRTERDDLGPNRRVIYPYEEQCKKVIARRPWVF